MVASLIRTCVEFSLLKQSFCKIIIGDNVRRHALHCLSLACTQCQYYHTTPQYFKTSTRSKNNSFRQLKPKKKLRVVDVWRRMTIAELATSVGRDMDDILEAISLSSPAFNKKHYNETTVIEDQNVLQNAVRKLGLAFKVIPCPDSIEAKKGTKDYDAIKRPPPDESVLVRRHPVVTIMGHVDHGKTTLLDTLRNTSVVKTEFGGITQHIGAFNVTLKTGETVTFLDTPGHAAFNLMRMRGAQVTDIVVLVVAADDGVMEQTVESINMAKAANVPIIVAINKIDKPEADINRTEKMLAEKGIIVEALGGDIQSVSVSALRGTNMDILTEAIALQAEIIGLKGDPMGLVEAVVIECLVDRYRGKLATALIQRGTLRKGSFLVSGLAWAKVRAMFDHSGNPVTEAKLSEAVQIIGWTGLPITGDEILEVENERKLRMVMRYREVAQAQKLTEEQKVVVDRKREEYLKEYNEHKAKRRALGRYHKLLVTIKNDEPDNAIPKLNIIIKGDVAGSVEAILDVFNTYGSDDKCRLNVVHYGVGAITETDLEMAAAFDAIIYYFNLDITKALEERAAKKRISVRPYNVIYKLVDDVKKEINTRLPSIDVEEMIGEANVLQEFEIKDGRSKVKIAGCRCTKGILKKNAMYHLKRNQDIIYTGKLTSMRHLKNEVDSIKTDVDCGLRFEDPQVSFKPGDILICYQISPKAQKTDWDPGF